MHRASLIIHIMLALTLVIFTIEQIWAPDSWWIEIRKIYIPDFTLGDPPPLVAMDETIHREFVAHYWMDIRKIGQADGKEEDLSRFSYFCSGEGELSFKPGVDPASNVNIDWWTRNRCPKFGEGSYYAQLILVWRDLIATRSLTSVSNVFTVSAPPMPDVPPPAQVIIEKPVTQVTQQVTREVTRIVPGRARCEPSLIPPRFCPEPRRRPGRRRVR